MGYDSRLRWSIRVVGALLLFAPAGPTGARRGPSMNADLDATATEPRHVAVAFRSWKGSKQ
jgi:hypothetical protein